MADSREALHGVFETFCAFGAGANATATMDTAKLNKLCKDCKILDKKLTTTDVDITFSKVKTKGARTITFEEFEKVLANFATIKGTSYDDLVAKIISSSGPASSGTKAAPTKFHDDKSLYTGTSAKGGPSTVDAPGITMEKHLDRSPADARGVKPSELSAPSAAPAPRSPNVPRAASAAKKPVPVADAPPSSLEELFARFCSFGAGANAKMEMDNAKFAKFGRDCGIIDKACSKTDMDIIFSKVKPKTGRTLDFAHFNNALAEIASLKKVSTAELTDTLLHSAGPLASGTQAQPNKFHDDKSLYTGVYVHGGPSTMGGANVTLDNHLDRSAADVRGVKK